MKDRVAAASAATVEKLSREPKIRTAAGTVMGITTSRGSTLAIVAIDGDEGHTTPVPIVNDVPPIGSRAIVIFTPPAGALLIHDHEGSSPT